MPYFIFKDISDEDSAAIVAYMRALPPVRAERPEREIDFPMNVLIRLWPEPLTDPVLTPDRADSVAYGAYLTAIGRCSFCHTPRAGRGIAGIPGKEFAGGVPFRDRFETHVFEKFDAPCKRHRQLDPRSLYRPFQSLFRAADSCTGRQHAHGLERLRRHDGGRPRRDL